MRQKLIDEQPGTRGYQGNISVEAVRPNKLLCMENWDNRDTIEDYLASRVETRAVDELNAMPDSAPEFRYYDVLSA